MQPPFAYPVPALDAAFDQFPWMSQLVPPKLSRPLKVQAHLSAFSAPPESYQALSCGSVSISDSSCPLTLASAATPCECRPEVSPGSQPGSPSRLKKNPNWISTPLQVPEQCQAQ